MIALLPVLLAAAGFLTNPSPSSDPFRIASLVPPDVRMYLHIDGAAGIRAEIADRSIARWVESLLADGQLSDAWDRLATAAGVEAAGLFDTSFGQRFTLVLRGREESAQWAVLTEIDPEARALLLDRLAPRVLGPKHNLPILHLPEHDLLLAVSGRLLLIGRPPQSGLFDEMVSNLTTPPGDSLAADPAMDEARQLGGGSAGLFMRHEPPMGGWSAVVVQLVGNQMKISHTAHFEHSPFANEVTETQWDVSPIDRLEDSTMLALIEPAGAGVGPLDAFVAAGLGEAAMTAEMRANLGPRQITTIADLDGRLQHPPFEVMLPTVARIYEVKDADLAWHQLDQHIVGLVESLTRIGQGKFELHVPDPATFAPGEPRRVDMGHVAKWLFGDLPGIGRLSLNWTVVDAPQGRWGIIATDPEHLKVVAEALAADPDGKPNLRQWANCGNADGRRLAEHLRTWRDQAARLAAPEDAEAVRHTLHLFSELADGIESCRWQLSRPDRNRMRLESQIILSPPESAR